MKILIYPETLAYPEWDRRTVDWMYPTLGSKVDFIHTDFRFLVVRMYH